MTFDRTASTAAALLLAACGTQPTTPNSANVASPAAQSPPMPAPREAPAAPAVSEPAAGQPSPSQRPLSEAETALSVARQFADLLSAKKYAQAYAMWKDGGPTPRPSAADFEKRFSAFRSVTARADPPGYIEGAAGSLYAEVPLTLSGLATGGEGYTRTGSVTLKRVNDVPGATAELLRRLIVDVKR
jgi:hypothetical protein